MQTTRLDNKVIAARLANKLEACKLPILDRFSRAHIVCAIEHLRVGDIASARPELSSVGKLTSYPPRLFHIISQVGLLDKSDAQRYERAGWNLIQAGHSSKALWESALEKGDLTQAANHLARAKKYFEKAASLFRMQNSCQSMGIAYELLADLCDGRGKIIMLIKAYAAYKKEAELHSKETNYSSKMMGRAAQCTEKLGLAGAYLLEGP